MVHDFIALRLVERRELAENAKTNPLCQIMLMFS